MNIFTSSYASTPFSVVSLDTVDSILNEQQSGKHQEFIQFLQHANALHVPILPLTWEPMFENLGPDGATGKVSQSTLNSELTFAYKRFNPEVTDPRFTIESYRTLQYNAMTSEMTVLFNSSLYNHPNIIALQGVCFEITTSGSVWPVLVFERCSLGNLTQYTARPESQNPEYLLSICGYCAQALNVMHQSGIVHGDFKPGNILIHEGIDKTSQGVKVIDFGFSAYSSNNEDSLRIARTEPWEAPEWHSRGFTLQDAKSMDIYSFGLVCMWLFFREEKLADLGFPSITLGEAFSRQKPDATSRIQALKRSGDDLLTYALRLLERRLDLEHGLRARLRQGLTLALASSPKERSASMEIFIELFCDPEYVVDPEPSEKHRAIESLDWHGIYSIENTYFNLETCDFRVHSFLAQSLISMARGEGCEKCSSNAAFQVALCYLLGFGVRPDRQESDKWLHRSTRTLDDMEDTLRRVRRAEMKAEANQSLTQLGYSGMLETTYQRDGVVHEAIQQYQEMIKVQEHVLGQTHFSPIRLRSLLITLMRYGDRNQNLEALNLAQSNLKIAEDRNVDQLDLFGLKRQIAKIYLELGYLETAELIAREMDDHFATGPHKDHISKLKNQEFLVSVLVKRENFHEAVHLGQKVEIACVRKLGIYHDSTLRAKRSLVEAYEGIGELEKALEFNENLVRARQACTAADNPILIEDISKLGVQYMLLGNHNAAEECYQNIATLVEENIKNATPAMISANSCAAKLLKRGKPEKCVYILEILIAKFETTLQAETLELVMMLGNLAAAYQHLEEWERAEPLERRVWEARRRLLGSGHPHTITALRNLAANLKQQNRFGEAATLYQQEVSILESLPGIEDQEMLAAVSEVARCLMSAEGWAGAVPFLEKELVMNPESLSGRVLLATCYMKLGYPSKARPMILTFLERLEGGAQGSPHTTICQAIDLAAACQEHGRLVEEEQVLVIGALLSRYLDDSQSELRQQVVGKVRDLLRRRGREEEGLKFDPSRIRDLIQKDEDGE